MSDLKTLSRKVIEKIEEENIEDKQEVEKLKKNFCSELGFNGMPKNSDILKFAEEDEKQAKKTLKTKPMRTISGIANIAIMARPAPCGGGCIYCPKGKDAPQSYTGKEPATRRAIRNEYDPYDQVHDRLGQYEKNGHSIDKSKLIIMGGTFPFQDPEYQKEFLKEAFNGFNTYRENNEKVDTLDEAKKINETAEIRNVGVTFETRPDICETEHIDRILELGGTRTEMGVQTVFDETHEITNRGHGMDKVIEATKRLKNAGFKVAYHLMLGLPGEGYEEDIEKFRKTFSDSDLQPDEVKIYPCEVIQGTELYRQYEEGDFDPIDDEEAKERLKKAQKDIIPPHVRVKRVMRDIPSTEVDAGPQLTNMRQMALQELHEEGERCSCIRCREVGHVKRTHDLEPHEENIELIERDYEASGGHEYFQSFEDTEADIILGFTRLRAPSESFREEINDDTLIVRQLKVMGSATDIGSEGDVQHKGYGTRLMESAEEKARELGRDKVVVISAVGTREYYRKFGYEKEGPYMVKYLD
ncbi:tRNA uridine(34) 5-carboxymethylaminomethyl modification radical SAM/GNAT enzyme Elp3 [Candidatus Nanohalobium constans]|uniref:tRNA carboxymethyluridine synthase n=1 Tax=Candidatus Nanohalobium constans TaxID=2565781 RepID=A0A5Q0UGG3_9ARCH|nr:tRNA uridine(34) 5-carboxymethylaminomethyl modification radical SAM/GNAT enzyme Elp3 [Candidatus Nanohalobium constans]QGA80732.1 histone acetyltransferase, ELP3 family [Candidatus Nanohalobium constans]